MGEHASLVPGVLPLHGLVGRIVETGGWNRALSRPRNKLVTDDRNFVAIGRARIKEV
jgi:hypothetical protein